MVGTRTSSPSVSMQSVFKKSRPRRAIHAAIESLEPRRLLSANVTSYHGDAASTGQDSTETLLTPSNVNSTDFGRIFDTTLDGQIYAQPLAVANLDITRGPSQGIHNVIFVATMHDSLFAIDSTTGQILWQDNFTQIANPEVSTILSPAPTTGVTTVPANSTENALVSSSDVGPELGIIDTPVINPNTNVLYLVADTQELRNGSTPVASYSTGVDYHFVERLWAINLADGSVAIASNNPAIEPTSTGQVIADTIKDPTGSNTIPTFNNYTGYEYVAGPFIKGTGNNSPSVPDADGWIVNSKDTNSPWGKLGETAPADGYIAFNAILQMGRTAISLINGNLYFGYASHGDDGPYYGWLLGYSASTLANTAAFITVPNFEPYSVSGGNDSTYDAQAGFWGSGMAITTDGTYLYVGDGNGAFNPNTSNFSSTYVSTDGTHTVELPIDDDYGDAVMKIAIDPNANQNGTPNGSYNPDNYDPNGYGLKIVDFFTASNEYEMNTHDEDMGSGGVLLIPASGPGYSNPDGDPMLVTGGKEGRIYLLDADNLGGYNTAYITDGYETTNQDPSSFDRVLGEFYYYESTHPGTNANNQSDKFYDTPSYFDGNIYYGLTGVPELEISVASLLAATSPPGSGVYSTIAHQTSTTFGSRATTATITSNAGNNAIVWNVNAALTPIDDLLAYNASTLATLYDSQTNASRDSLTNGGNLPGSGKAGATGVKFEVPTVFNGMVYVGTGGGSGTSGVAMGTLVGYGLLPSFAATSSDFQAPSNPSAVLSNSNQVTFSWTSNSPDATEFEIDRSVGGGSFSILAYVANSGATTYQYIDNTIVSGDSYTYEVRAISGGTMTLPATGGPTAESTTAFATASVVTNETYAIQSGSTLQINLSSVGPVSLSQTGSVLTAGQNGTQVGFTGISSITVTDTGSGDTFTYNGGVTAPFTFNSTSSSTLNINGATLTFAAHQGGTINLGSVSIANGGVALITATTTQQPTTLVIDYLSIGSTGDLNASNNVVLIDYAPGDDPITTIGQYLKSGFDKGWLGYGIESTQAADNFSSYGLGYADSADPGNPANLPTHTIEIKYTLLGDANLDGVVDGTDFAILSANFNKGVTGWDQGDFNYDNVVDGTDFGFLSANFNKGANIAAAQPAVIVSPQVTPPVTDPTPTDKLKTQDSRDHQRR